MGTGRRGVFLLTNEVSRFLFSGGTRALDSPSGVRVRQAICGRREPAGGAGGETEDAGARGSRACPTQGGPLGYQGRRTRRPPKRGHSHAAPVARSPLDPREPGGKLAGRRPPPSGEAAGETVEAHPPRGSPRRPAPPLGPQLRPFRRVGLGAAKPQQRVPPAGHGPTPGLFSRDGGWPATLVGRLPCDGCVPGPRRHLWMSPRAPGSQGVAALSPKPRARGRPNQESREKRSLAREPEENPFPGDSVGLRDLWRSPSRPLPAAPAAEASPGMEDPPRQGPSPAAGSCALHSGPHAVTEAPGLGEQPWGACFWCSGDTRSSPGPASESPLCLRGPELASPAFHQTRRTPRGAVPVPLPFHTTGSQQDGVGFLCISGSPRAWRVPCCSWARPPGDGPVPLAGTSPSVHQ